MRIENGYLQQSMLCSKNNRNAVGNFSDTMNKAQECISNKISTMVLDDLSFFHSTTFPFEMIISLSANFRI